MDIKQIRQALEMYYDENDTYPVSSWADADSTVSARRTNWSNLESALSPYLKVLPQDPKDDSTSSVTSGYSYSYYATSYGGTGQWYMLVFRLENSPHLIESQDGVTACNGHLFHYGSGSNGIVTIGGDCAN
jgi:hypothetical protein